MFGRAQEKKPLIGSKDPKAQSALDQLSSSFGDSEGLFGKPPPSRPQTFAEQAVQELKRRWWLWGSVAFVVLLLGSLFVFRGALYDTASHGLPFLAVKEAAAEECASVCKESTAKDNSGGGDSYEACYAKCVAQETKEIAAERADFKKSEEEELEKTVADKGKAAVDEAAKVVGKP